VSIAIRIAAPLNQNLSGTMAQKRRGRPTNPSSSPQDYNNLSS